MLRILQFLFSGCFHTWKPTSQSTYENFIGKGPCVYVVCTKCGARKSFNNATIGQWEKQHEVR